jgi:hypothetical protein
VSYRPVLTARAAAQFADLSRQQKLYQAFMDRLLKLIDAPWDARLVQPGGGEPEFARPCSVTTGFWRSG